MEVAGEPPDRVDGGEMTARALCVSQPRSCKPRRNEDHEEGNPNLSSCSSSLRGLDPHILILLCASRYGRRRRRGRGREARSQCGQILRPSEGTAPCCQSTEMA